MRVEWTWCSVNKSVYWYWLIQLSQTRTRNKWKNSETKWWRERERCSLRATWRITGRGRGRGRGRRETWTVERRLTLTFLSCLHYIGPLVLTLFVVCLLAIHSLFIIFRRWNASPRIVLCWMWIIHLRLVPLFFHALLLRLPPRSVIISYHIVT